MIIDSGLLFLDILYIHIDAAALVIYDSVLSLEFIFFKLVLGILDESKSNLFTSGPRRTGIFFTQ